ncbi:lactate dehydrogenase [Lactobacillus mulieris]|jgi:4-phosphoerythronate dehydrogenase|uniref:NAD(P)-dependent oxidoreductase n=1 Tax=Lactobacillus TaxID=1578 RepID=UPI00117A92E4|nr:MULTISPECIES: NAD(P)-dependent oxidoreductase [Lactobacillus]KAA9243618.1 lactate dehydrogenase [Lactobacillus jensenii]MCW8124296.1 lactate dehydrogenase [Lactobacillus mulieris]MDK7327511.1 NAD(P)-dependent oxidoreductase [Lactobacillus mulieris]TRT38352.1 lactate dehydrogenase [Lactobacillus sp. c10Ua232AE]TRT41124.1 lactate dehydrogenase [Lactobacillus mulieris]
MKIVCYGVRPIEKPYFEKLNKYNYDLKLVEEFLTHDNADEAEGCDAVLTRGNCVCDRKNLEQFKSYGINWVFTRSVGYNHYDLAAAKDLGITIARVPNYSPYAVANLAFDLGASMVRHTVEAIQSVHGGDFTMHPRFFSNEYQKLTVGIYGAGKIGAIEGKLWKAMGAKVLAYDPYPSDFAKQYVEFVSSDELLKKSDVVSIHVPYFPCKNENLVNADFLKKMKKTAFLVNTARGELGDTKAIKAAVESEEIAGYAADVVIDETEIMAHKFASLDEIPNEDVKELMKLYPRVLLTPHMGSFTEPALEDMISISFDNFHEMSENGTCKNLVK